MGDLSPSMDDGAVDVKTAFLNADFIQGPEEDTIIVLQPQTLKEKKYFPKAACLSSSESCIWIQKITAAMNHRNSKIRTFWV